jgi:hypothetical protein
MAWGDACSQYPTFYVFVFNTDTEQTIPVRVQAQDGFQAEAMVARRLVLGDHVVGVTKEIYRPSWVL